MKKFNLGDFVYFMHENSIAKGEITYLQTIEQKKQSEGSYPSKGFEFESDPKLGLKEVQTTYTVSFGGYVSFGLNENLLFSTMEELLETLKRTSL